jgi:bifunctional UDP-N-acetylglucosamine pyrophosphorylase/glucosamine-1-phosphate N-acetyltransferase
MSSDVENMMLDERRIIQERAYALLANGVKIRDTARIDIRGDLTCGNNVEIDINTIFEGKVHLADGVRIGANCIIINSTIGSGTTINSYSLIDNAVIGEKSFVGPYGRIRPGSHLGDVVQVGNFVEIKNSSIGTGSRINHLAFVGDAELGNNVTIGAGSITCNHNSIEINKTTIEDGAFIGSNCNLVAPITIGSHSTIGSGSTVTEDVPPGKLTLARSKQVTLDNWNGPKSNKDE